MDLSNLLQLYESNRILLLKTEPITKAIEQIKNPQLKEKLIELSQTVQCDLLILTDFLYEATQCETESDIDLLLEINSALCEPIS